MPKIWAEPRSLLRPRERAPGHGPRVRLKRTDLSGQLLPPRRQENPTPVNFVVELRERKSHELNDSPSRNLSWNGVRVAPFRSLFLSILSVFIAIGGLVHESDGQFSLLYVRFLPASKLTIDLLCGG